MRNTIGTPTTVTSAARTPTRKDLKPPLRMRWARRLEGTVKHLPVCGGGRMYMHTAEGQIIAVEQDTGRLLWRRYWPDVYLSFTSPLYVDGKLIVPQAGIKQSRMRCLDAATGKLLVGSSFHRITELESSVPAGRSWKRCDLRIGIGRVCGSGHRKTVYVSRSNRLSARRQRGDELDLLQRQSLLSQRPSPAYLGVGLGDGRDRLGKRFFGVRPRWQ